MCWNVKFRDFESGLRSLRGCEFWLYGSVSRRDSGVRRGGRGGGVLKGDGRAFAIVLRVKGVEDGFTKINLV